MSIRLLFALCFCVALTSRASAQSSVRINNFADEFLMYWDDVKELPIEAQVAQFKSDIVPFFPQFYEYQFGEWRRRGLDVDAQLATILADFPSMEPSFRQRAASFEEELTSALSSFKERFPGLRDDFEVNVIHGLYSMDGGTRILDGNVYVIFGIDGIVRYHTGASDVPFFHHELFHVYHLQNFPGSNSVYEGLWVEGLATYVSHVMNPEADWRELLLDVPVGLVAMCEERLDFLLADVSTRLESTAFEDYEIYFLSTTTNPDVPMRAGYYLGYLVARKLAERYTLDELVELQGDDLLREMRMALRELEAENLRR